MNRDEAIKTVHRCAQANMRLPPDCSLDEPAMLIDTLVALGLLKLDESQARPPFVDFSTKMAAAGIEWYRDRPDEIIIVSAPSTLSLDHFMKAHLPVGMRAVHGDRVWPVSE